MTRCRDRRERRRKGEGGKGRQKCVWVGGAREGKLGKRIVKMGGEERIRGMNNGREGRRKVTEKAEEARERNEKRRIISLCTFNRIR